jgi:hypothetical protein
MSETAARPPPLIKRSEPEIKYNVQTWVESVIRHGLE